MPNTQIEYPVNIGGLDIQGFLRISKRILGEENLGKELFTLKIKGNSPSLNDGDYVVADNGKKAVEQGALLVVVMEPYSGACVMRCVECSEERVVLMQESNKRPSFLHPKDLEEFGEKIILGTVVKIIPGHNDTR